MSNSEMGLYKSWNVWVLPRLSSIMTCAAFQWMGKYLVLRVALKIIVSILTVFGGISSIILPLIRSKPGDLLVLMSAISLLIPFMVVLGMSLVYLRLHLMLLLCCLYRCIERCYTGVLRMLDFSGALLAQLPSGLMIAGSETTDHFSLLAAYHVE